MTEPTSTLHLRPEALLLYGLGLPLGAPARDTQARRHLDGCPGCRDRLDRVLVARFGAEDDAGVAGGPAAAPGPIRAAAAAARTWETPELPHLLGEAEVIGGPGARIAIFQRSDVPGLFAFDRLDLAGKTIRIRRRRVGGESEPISGTVDRFGRLRLPSADAERLATLLAGEEDLTIEVT